MLFAAVAGLVCAALAQKAVRSRTWAWRTAAALCGLAALAVCAADTLGRGGSIWPAVVVTVLISASYAFSPRGSRAGR
ncbi:hypothetical protein [Cellulomonas xiejunii]|uniref:Uncharacterized protein n=1 Tax=Cellulomonas xiejunii TaxID=2968083 RepID=A0ABY5KM14_9CELL|nr:hypothetical protein [Cellulomonas xiejunii]MCC2314149.1 hypothetical protein [Cellulomonas xiejunii]MCC2323533.1 hypothetical protein [Cellulomonas xiejunii]UUI71539.1 hypothetical protein NP048_17380 [Cellulomonas xiejunii]